MNLGAGQPAIPPEDVFFLAMNCALKDAIASLQSELQNVIHDAFEQLRLTTPTLTTSQRRLEHSSTPISHSEIEIVHSHLYRARCKQVALTSTTATGGVKKRHRSRLGTIGSLATCKHPKRKVTFQRLVAEVAQDVKADWRFPSSVVPSLLGNIVSVQVNNTHSVSDTGTLSLLNNGCGAVDSVFVAKLGEIDENWDNWKEQSSDKSVMMNGKQNDDDTMSVAKYEGRYETRDNLKGESLNNREGADVKAVTGNEKQIRMMSTIALLSGSSMFVSLSTIKNMGTSMPNSAFPLPTKNGDHKTDGTSVKLSDQGLSLCAESVSHLFDDMLQSDWLCNTRQKIVAYMGIRDKGGGLKQEFRENAKSAACLDVCEEDGGNLAGNKSLSLQVPTKCGLQKMDKWQLYVVVHKGFSHMIPTSLDSEAEVLDLPIDAVINLGIIPALCIWLNSNMLCLFLENKLDKTSLVFVDKFDKMERDAKLVIGNIWKRWKSLIFVTNDYCTEELHEIFPDNHMKLDGKCLLYFGAMELVRKLATGVKHASSDEELKFPNATLHIILELESWETESELVVGKNVIKKVLQMEGYERPNEDDVVTVELIGNLHYGKEYLKAHGEREGPCGFNIDAEQVIEELDKVVVTLNKGEIALVIIFSEYAVGALEAQPRWIMVPPNSTLYYVVDLVSVIVVEDQKYEVDGKQHEGGNSHTINIMADVHDGMTFSSACFVVQVHVEDVTIIASIGFHLNEGALIYKKLIMMAGSAYEFEKMWKKGIGFSFFNGADHMSFTSSPHREYTLKSSVEYFIPVYSVLARSSQLTCLWCSWPNPPVENAHVNSEEEIFVHNLVFQCSAALVYGFSSKEMHQTGFMLFELGSRKLGLNKEVVLKACDSVNKVMCATESVTFLDSERKIGHQCRICRRVFGLGHYQGVLKRGCKCSGLKREDATLHSNGKQHLDCDLRTLKDTTESVEKVIGWFVTYNSMHCSEAEIEDGEPVISTESLKNGLVIHGIILADVIPPSCFGVTFDDIKALGIVKNRMKKLVMLSLQRPELFCKSQLTKNGLTLSAQVDSSNGDMLNRNNFLGCLLLGIKLIVLHSLGIMVVLQGILYMKLEVKFCKRGMDCYETSLFLVKF